MRKDAVLFAGTTVFAAVLAFHFWNQSRAASAQMIELREQVQQLQAARAAAPASPSSGNALVQPAPAPVAAPTAPPATAVLTSASQPIVLPAMACESLISQARQTTAGATAEIAAELKLTPAETRRIAELREAQMLQTSPCGAAEGPRLSSEQAEAQIAAFLGPARYEQLQEFNTVRATSSNVLSLATQVSAKGAPLTDEQARKLTATILEENRRSRVEARYPYPPEDPHARLAYEEERLRLTEERYDRTLSAAQSYLRQEQIDQLRDNTRRQIEAMRAAAKRMRASVEAGRGISSEQPVIVPGSPAR